MFEGKGAVIGTTDPASTNGRLERCSPSLQLPSLSSRPRGASHPSPSSLTYISATPLSHPSPFFLPSPLCFPGGHLLLGGNISLISYISHILCLVFPRSASLALRAAASSPRPTRTGRTGAMRSAPTCCRWRTPRTRPTTSAGPPSTSCASRARSTLPTRWKGSPGLREGGCLGLFGSCLVFWGGAQGLIARIII